MKLMTKLFAITAIATATLMAMSQASAATLGTSELTTSLGFTKSAVSLGAQYDKGSQLSDIGGYIFIQTNKDKNSIPVVNQVLSFGGQMKVHASAGRADLYAAPGVGLHMIKDVYDTATAKKDDVTTFGPTLRLGVLFPMTAAMKVGIERFDIANWFDDKAGSASSYTYYQAAMSFNF